MTPIGPTVRWEVMKTALAGRLAFQGVFVATATGQGEPNEHFTVSLLRNWRRRLHWNDRAVRRRQPVRTIKFPLPHRHAFHQRHRQPPSRLVPCPHRLAKRVRYHPPGNRRRILRRIHHLLHLRLRVQQTCRRRRCLPGHRKPGRKFDPRNPRRPPWYHAGSMDMSLLGEQILLRIYLQSADRAPRIPSYERIVAAARKDKLAGATVLRGIFGAGYHGIIKPTSWSIVEHVPIIVEIVDSPENIMAFVHGPLNEIMIGGMLTLERAAVLMYRPRSEPQPNSLRLAATLEPLSTIPHIEPGSNMKIKENGILLRAFIGESDKFENKPLYEAIVQKVRELG